MTKSGILETRSHLSQIVNKVMHGDEHLILRKNVPVAKIVPIKENLKANAKELFDRVMALRAQAKKVTIKEILAWKKEGRA